ncbi:MAG: hypothetical protein CR996_00170 [Draconibacterium sp.]|nr:MAG: hypothetical protein CR996_00170 [Draconibacterium sp.]PIF06447.1 MAG: hypothetical protein CSA36_01350 [Draconibacterium sp.]
MNKKEDYLSEIKGIRKMIEESSRFLSLSGLSGILIGVYALTGAFLAYRVVYIPYSLHFRKTYANDALWQLAIIAAATLVLSLVTTLWLTHNKAKKAGVTTWNRGSKLMLINLAIPLATGGILSLIFLSRGIYTIISPAFLIFYGLALVNAAKYTRNEIFYIGIIQIILGLMAALMPGFGIIFWALGFGIVHIIYGILMYYRYEHITKE